MHAEVRSQQDLAGRQLLLREREHREVGVTEEDQPPAGRSSRAASGIQRYGIAPDRRPVLRDREVEASRRAAAPVRRRRGSAGTCTLELALERSSGGELASRSCRGRPAARPGGRATPTRILCRTRAPRRRGRRARAAVRARTPGTRQTPQPISSRPQSRGPDRPTRRRRRPSSPGSRARGPLASRHDTVGAEGCVGTDGRADGHGAGEDRRGRRSRRHQDPDGGRAERRGRGPRPADHTRFGSR